MDLVVFENNKPWVIDEFREGRFDYVELASDVAETSVLEGFVAKRSSPPSDPKAPDAQVDDYDPADHVEDIPAEGLEFSPDFNAQTSTRSNWPL